MTQLYTQTSVEERPAVDLNWLTQTARTLVGNVMRHMRMDAAERSIFREDLQQEALTQLYELKFIRCHDDSYAYVAARTNLIGYVFVNIRGGGSGHQWELSKQYRTDDNLTEPEYIDENSQGERTFRLPVSVYKRRPVEAAVEAHEAAPVEAEQWLQFEREITRILAVMRGNQWHPNSLRRAATALCESAKGTSNYNIACKLDLDWHTTTALIIHYRAQVKAFLDMSPLAQGLVRAEGELRLCWWDEVTEAALNSGQKFIVILPFGAFTVGYYRSASKDKHLGRIQLGRRINGRVVNRSVQLGEVGRITKERLWDGAQRLQAKLATLEGSATVAAQTVAA